MSNSPAKRQKISSSDSALTRVALLKSLEDASAAAFRATPAFTALKGEDLGLVERVVFQSNLAGVAEFSDEFFRVLGLKALRMQFCRDHVTDALQRLGDKSGFSAMERALVVGSAGISAAYDKYYFAFMRKVQDGRVKAKLEASPPAKDSPFMNSYTILRLSGDGGDGGDAASSELTHAPIAESFPDEVFAPVLAAFDACIKGLKEAHGAAAAAAAAAAGDGAGAGAGGDGSSSASYDWPAYIAFFEQYRAALAGTDIAALDDLWKELDRKWMDCKGPIQIVHDIETGYGDPLRVKATPDFSLRFLDDTYAKENETMGMIKELLCSYYKGRDTALSGKGLAALSNTMSGIYHIPFKTGMSLQFSYSGQSIPNRLDVKVEKGVKIYCDAVETQARVAQNEKLVEKVFADAAESVIRKYKPDALDQLVWHVAAHEVGHAIYGISNCAKVSADAETCLEEPRAELTAMFTLRMLRAKGILTQAELERHVAHFALDGLRYFSKYDSAALHPYIIFQIYAYKVYHKHGYLKEKEEAASGGGGGGGGLVFDDSKVDAVLDEFAATFEAMLKCLDEDDGAGLERILRDDLEPETDFVRGVVAKVFPAAAAAAAAKA